MSSAVVRDALILKLWSEGVARRAIRERVGCGAGVLKRVLRASVGEASVPASSRRPRGQGWTPERIERAKRMWLAGESASTIGAALGVSRNAVLGKLGRLGVARSEEVNQQNLKTGAGPRHVSGEAEPLDGSEPESRLRLRRPRREDAPTTDLMGLSTHACRWPIGEPEAAGFGFCGRPKRRGAYCERHAARAYQAGPLEPIERVAGLKPTAPPESREAAVFDAWDRR